MSAQEQGRWSRASACSLALHLVLALAAWIAFARPGSDVVSIRYLDMLSERGSYERFAPGVLVPIEFETIAVPTPATPSPGEATGPGQGRAARWRAGEVEPKLSGAGEARATSTLPDEDLRAGELEPDPGLLRGREEVAGLAGSGSQQPGVGPGLLVGSRALYDESAGEGEGPRRPGVNPGTNKDYSFQKEGGKWIYRHPDGSLVATLQDDGGVLFRSKLIKVRGGSMPGVRNDGENFFTVTIEHDSVGLARLASGREPHARVKAELLAATFEMRMEVAERYQKRRLIDELGQLGDELDGIWNAGGRSLAARKQLLFLRWDDCDEDGSSGDTDAEISALDDTRRGLARAARRKIIRFIADVAPQGSPEAYTVQELADMNRRRASTQAFAPYG